jgi:NAD(P)-dependent dehydrogenase (short-subunit alcohol dehydrogenase family)
MDRMKDKFVVVTGAAHGIGAAIAQRFAEEGGLRWRCSISTGRNWQRRRSACPARNRSPSPRT